MYYICLENNQIVSQLNYEPNVPESIEVIEITDEEHQNIIENTHFFNIKNKKVESYSDKELNKIKTNKEKLEKNQDNYRFLNSSDWKILRHLREKALNIKTSLTEKEYLDLEKKRDEISKSIIK